MTSIQLLLFALLLDLLEDAGLCESQCWCPSSYGNCPRLQKGGTAAKQDWIWSAARALLITPSILVDLAKRASLMTPEGVANPPPWQMSKSLVNNRTRVKRNKWPFRIGREVENVWRLARRGSWALIGAGNGEYRCIFFLWGKMSPQWADEDGPYAWGAFRL